MYFRSNENGNPFAAQYHPMIHELIIACLLGLIGGMIPGPVITAVFTEVLQSGYLKSLRIALICHRQPMAYIASRCNPPGCGRSCG